MEVAVGLNFEVVVLNSEAALIFCSGNSVAGNVEHIQHNHCEFGFGSSYSHGGYTEIGNLCGYLVGVPYKRNYAVDDEEDAQLEVGENCVFQVLVASLVRQSLSLNFFQWINFHFLTHIQ